MFKREKYLDNIIDKLNLLRGEIKSRGKLGLYDINNHCEDFFCSILNIIYDSNLENLNAKHLNYPGIDLGDKNTGISYQITSEKDSSKIEVAIETVIDKNVYQTFKHLRFLILTEKQGSYTKEFKTDGLIEFDKDKDILDIDDLFKLIKNLTTDKVIALSNFIDKEIETIKESLEVKSKTDEIKTPASLIDFEGIKLIQPTIDNIIHFEVDLIIENLNGKTSASLYRLLQDNKVIQDKITYPFILANSCQKQLSPFVIYVNNIPSGAVNHFSQEKLKIDKNKLTYEYAQFDNYTPSSLLKIDYPFLSILYLILTLKKGISELSIDINIRIKSPRNFFLQQNEGDAFPYDSRMNLYYADGNSFEIKTNLKNITQELLYTFYQNIFDHFIAKEHSLHPGFPFPILKKDVFDFNLSQYLKYYNLSGI